MTDEGKGGSVDTGGDKDRPSRHAPPRLDGIPAGRPDLTVEITGGSGVLGGLPEVDPTHGSPRTVYGIRIPYFGWEGCPHPVHRQMKDGAGYVCADCGLIRLTW